jgi:hypothetical protein
MIFFFSAIQSTETKKNKPKSKWNTQKSLIVSFLVFFTLLIFNCATSTAGMVTSNTPIGDKKYTIVGPIKEEISWYSFDIGFIGFPFENPPIENLTSTILANNNADALVNIRYWNEKSVYLFITRNKFGISAEAVKWEETIIPIKGKNK